MPQFNLPIPRRYNTLRLLGYDYNSTWQLCAISLVTDLRRPLFADVNLAKSVLKALLSDQTLEHMRLRAFTLMPNHLHFLAGVREPEKKLPNLIGLLRVTRHNSIGNAAGRLLRMGKSCCPRPA